MSGISQFDGAINNRISLLAKRLRSLMERNHVNSTELARRCDTLAHEIFAENERPNLTRERISKILMNAQSRVGKGAAKVVTAREIVVFSKVFNVSREWLTGEAKNDAPILWDAMSNPDVAAHLLHLLAEYEERTGELFLWGETLLCSLTPPDFSHELHLALFKELSEIGLTDEMNRLVKIYDSVGDSRRKRFFENSGIRDCEIKQIVFLSELKNIARGEQLYSQINACVRRKCLDGLIEALKTDEHKIKLIVVKDENACKHKWFLRDFDRFSVNGDKFSTWSSHSGRVMWTENKTKVLQNREILMQMESISDFRQNGQILDLLFQLREQIQN